jgi:hypothetical protein
MAQRPTFLSIIAILLAIYGVLMLIAGIAMILLNANSEVIKVFTDNGIRTDWITAIGLVALVLGILALAVAFFLWKGMAIGWYLAMIFLIINAIWGLLTLWAGLLTLIVSAVLIWYFLRPKVRGFFGT